MKNHEAELVEDTEGLSAGSKSRAGEILKSMEIPFLYCIGYYYIYLVSFIWNVLYDAPKSIEMVIEEEHAYYTNTILGGAKVYDLLRFLATMLAPLFLMGLLAAVSSFVKKGGILERVFCCIFFISVISVILINPFIVFNSIFQLGETYKIAIIILCLLSAIEMLICLIINKKAFSINPLILASAISIILVVEINLTRLAFLNKSLTYVPIFPFIDESSEKGVAILQFCKKHGFPTSNVYAETKDYADFTLAMNYGFKRLSSLFVGSESLKNLNVNEILAVLEHEMEHIGLLNFGFELVLVAATSFLFIHFIRRRILSHTKNFTIGKIVLSTMKLLIFLKMLDLCNYLSLMLIEYHSDSKAHAESNTCVGMVSMLSRYLYWPNPNESHLSSANTIAVYHPNSLYHPFPSVVSRILMGLKNCPNDMQFKINYRK